MGFELPPVLYNAVQHWARGDQRAYLDMIAAAHCRAGGGPALELGCGTGTLSRAFEPGIYTGIDSDAARIARAQADYPQANFVVGDASAVSPQILSGFGFVFAFGFLHHIPDEAVRRLLALLAQASTARPIAFFAAEPLRPDRPWHNPFSWLIARVDRGRWVRTHQENVDLLGPLAKAPQVICAKWRWPVPIAGYSLLFPIRGSAAPTTPTESSRLPYTAAVGSASADGTGGAGG